MTKKKAVLLIATLDTKGEEARYIKEKLEKEGKEVLILDCGLAGVARWVKGDITRYAVAGKAGIDYEKLQSLSRAEAEEVMVKGVASLVKEFYKKKKFDGVLGIGGYDGSILASAGMRELPVGFPKLLLSAMACGDIKFGEYVGARDITIMPSVYDIVGVNSLTCKVFDNAVAAICGMVDMNTEIRESTHNIIALTMFGQTNPCGSYGKRMLEEEGFNVVAFHPNRVGGAAMEEMVNEGAFCGVWDLTTQEISEEAAFGIQPARSGMLVKGSSGAIPRVVVPGCMDFIWGHPEQTERFNNRETYNFNRSVLLGKLRLNEISKAGQLMAVWLNRSPGSMTLVLPLRGLSKFDKEGEGFYDPEKDRLLFEVLKSKLDPGVKLVEVDAHINDPEFAKVCVMNLIELFPSD